MNTQYDENLILGYIEGDLSDNDRRAFEAQMAGDARLRSLVDGMTDDRNHLRALPEEQPPFDLMERITERLERDMLLGDDGRHAGPAVAGSIGTWRFGRMFAYGSVAALLAFSTVLVYQTLLTTNGLSTTIEEATGPKLSDRELAMAEDHADQNVLEQGEFQDGSSRSAELKRQSSGTSGKMASGGAAGDEAGGLPLDSDDSKQLDGSLALADDFKKGKDLLAATPGGSGISAKGGDAKDNGNLGTKGVVSETHSGNGFARLTREDTRAGGGTISDFRSVSAERRKRSLQSVVDEVSASDSPDAMKRLEASVGRVQRAQQVYVNVTGDVAQKEVELQAWARREGVALVPTRWLSSIGSSPSYKDSRAGEPTDDSLWKEAKIRPDANDEPVEQIALAKDAPRQNEQSATQVAMTMLVPRSQLPQLHKMLQAQGKFAIDTTPQETGASKLAEKKPNTVPAPTATVSPPKTETAAAPGANDATKSREPDLTERMENEKAVTGSLLDRLRGATGDTEGKMARDAQDDREAIEELGDSSPVAGEAPPAIDEQTAGQKAKTSPARGVTTKADAPKSDVDGVNVKETADAEVAMEEASKKKELPLSDSANSEADKLEAAPIEADRDAEGQETVKANKDANDWLFLLQRDLPLTPQTPLPAAYLDFSGDTESEELVAVPVILRLIASEPVAEVNEKETGSADPAKPVDDAAQLESSH